MSNTLLTPTMITREALRVLHAKLGFISKVSREYDDRFAVSGAKIGSTLNIRKPPKYTTRTGATLTTQDATETYVSLPVTNQVGIDLTFSSVELTMQIDDFSKRFIEPAMAQLASTIEANVLAQAYKTVANQVGSATSPLNALRPVLKAKQRMTDNLANPGGRHFLVNTDSTVEMVDSLKGLFQSSTGIADQYEEGQLGQVGGYKFFENTLLPTHTTGTYAGTVLINGSTANAATQIVTDGWSSGGLKNGDVITIDGVYAVHPETKTTLGYLKQFVVTEDVTSSGGAATIKISPAIYDATTGKGMQNVSALPADNAAVTVFSASAATYGLNLAFVKEAFAFATADLEDVSQYGAWGAREQFDGISMRIARQYAIGTDTVPCRIDILYGSTALYPELACRVANSISAT